MIRHNLVATLEEVLPMKLVGSAEDEAAALKWMREAPQHVDLLIIDVFLRAGSGLEVVRQAHALRPQAKVVVLTNYATDELRRRAGALGADRVFDKSSEVDELLAYCDQLGSADEPSAGH